MKRALLTGINNYKNAPLRGCINDVLLMHKVLKEQFNFDEITVLTDEQVLKNNIFDKLSKIVSKSKPGDTIFFHYSGHGSQVVSNNWTDNEEADGLDEIICTYDLDWNNPLRDQDLGNIFKVKGDVKITIILDSCHSGTGLRNNSKPIILNNNTIRNRFLAPPVDNLLYNPKIKLDDNLNFVLPKYNPNDRQTHKKSFLVETTKQGNAILISGCKENQYSADAYIGGRFHGALTYLLVQTLMENNFKIKYKNLISKLNSKTNKLNFSQTPQLEGKKELFENYF